MAHRVVYTRPYDAEVEYLENSGNDRPTIITNIKPSTNYTYKWKYKILNLTNYNYIFSNDTSITLGNWFLFGGIETDNKTQLHINNKSNIQGTPLQTNVLYEGVLRRNGNKIEEYFNNVLYVSLPYQNFTASDYLRYLRGNKSDSIQLFYLQILDANNNTILDFIPVRVGQVGYMYDKVSGKLFGNKGTGNFILGPDVVHPIPNIRRVFRFGNKRFVMPMPYDSKVEYLESTGTQWIDTGIYGSNNSKVEVDLQLLELGSSKAVFGCYSANRASLYMYQAGGDNYGKWQFGFGHNANCGRTDTNRHLVVCENFDLTIDGSLIFSHSPRNFTTPRTLLMFNMHNNSGGIYSATDIRIFSCKLYNGNTLVRDFIPVRRGNVGYMYDRVSGKLFGNSGTGQFILGNDIND